MAKSELGIPTYERQIDRTELYTADEVFMCGTGAQIAPVVSVDHRSIGTGEIGPLSTKIQTLYSEVVPAFRPEYMHWLTPTQVSNSKKNRRLVGTTSTTKK